MVEESKDDALGHEGKGSNKEDSSTCPTESSSSLPTMIEESKDDALGHEEKGSNKGDSSTCPTESPSLAEPMDGIEEGKFVSLSQFINDDITVFDLCNVVSTEEDESISLGSLLGDNDDGDEEIVDVFETRSLWMLDEIKDNMIIDLFGNPEIWEFSPLCEEEDSIQIRLEHGYLSPSDHSSDYSLGKGEESSLQSEKVVDHAEMGSKFEESSDCPTEESSLDALLIYSQESNLISLSQFIADDVTVFDLLDGAFMEEDESISFQRSEIPHDILTGTLVGDEEADGIVGLFDNPDIWEIPSLDREVMKNVCSGYILPRTNEAINSAILELTTREVISRKLVEEKLNVKEDRYIHMDHFCHHGQDKKNDGCFGFQDKRKKLEKEGSLLGNVVDLLSITIIDSSLSLLKDSGEQGLDGSLFLSLSSKKEDI